MKFYCPIWTNPRGSSMIRVIVIFLFILHRATSFRSIMNAHVLTSHHCANSDGTIWPGNRPPVTNPERMEQRMDSTWGGGKFRTEVWEGNVNPVDFWWEAYMPSEEEVQASNAGYDFSNPKKWHEERGIDYDSAKREMEKAAAIQYEAFRAKRDKQEREFNMEYFTDSLRVMLRHRFRERDNKLQELKGQPSLDEEDTGRHWKAEVASRK